MNPTVTVIADLTGRAQNVVRRLVVVELKGDAAWMRSIDMLASHSGAVLLPHYPRQHLLSEVARITGVPIPPSQHLIFNRDRTWNSGTVITIDVQYAQETNDD